jgi:hypothetical protein
MGRHLCGCTPPTGIRSPRIAQGPARNRDLGKGFVLDRRARLHRLRRLDNKEFTTGNASEPTANHTEMMVFPLALLTSQGH